MGGCGVPTCGSRSEVNYVDGIRFHSIPSFRKNVPPHAKRRYERRRAMWLSKIGRMDLMNVETNIKICSRHFLSCKPANPTAEYDPDWVPSVNLGENDVPFSDLAQLAEVAELCHAVVNADPESDLLVEDQPGGAMQVVAEGLYEENPLTSEANSESAIIPQSESSVQGYLEESLDTLTDIEGEVDDDNISVREDFGFVGDIANSTALDDYEASHLFNLQAEYSDLVKSKCKLRDELTEAEVSNLELTAAMTESYEKCQDLSRKCEDLETKTADHKAEVEQYQARIRKLEEQAEVTETKIGELEAKLSNATKCILTLDKLQNDDSLVMYYTGLPCYGVFNAVLTLVTSHVNDKTRSLEPWQCLLLTLMRLRLGLQLQDLGHRFGVGKTTAAFIFEKWLHYLYVYLEPCIIWPDRETLHKTMPNSFKAEFGKSVAVIIDCFELFCERPGPLDSRAMTWSNYKHHNTVKFLIGITPLGSVSFISQGWGGRVSDKHITANSGLYEKLLPHNVILADRGFTITEDVGFYCARVLTPAFTRGQAQLSAHDITDTRRLAVLRVHIERVIGNVKNRYGILKTTLHHDFLVVKPGHKVAQIDEMVRVCCALTNLSPGIV